MEDPFERGPECDFCGLNVEEGESLEPLYVGELPQPKPHRLSETASKRRGAHNGMYNALKQALRDCPDIDLTESEYVEEIQAVGGEKQISELEYGTVPAPTQFEANTRDDRVGVSLKIRPKDVTYTPDAELCHVCIEMFRSLSD